MDIKLWGPSLWELLHTISFSYNNYPLSPIKKKHYILFFDSLRVLIPCHHCRYHYSMYLRKRPIGKYVNSRASMVKWVNDLHNQINKKLRKKVYTQEESRKRYYSSSNSLIINHNRLQPFIRNCIYNPNFSVCKRFMNSLLYIYPCEKCRINLNKRNSTYKIGLTNIKTIRKWHSKMDFGKLH